MRGGGGETRRKKFMVSMNFFGGNTQKEYWNFFCVSLLKSRTAASRTRALPQADRAAAQWERRPSCARDRTTAHDPTPKPQLRNPDLRPTRLENKGNGMIYNSMFGNQDLVKVGAW